MNMTPAQQTNIQRPLLLQHFLAIVAGLLLGGCAAMRPAPEGLRWTSGIPMLQERAAHAVASDLSGIYALAGTGKNGNPVGTVEHFDGQAWKLFAQLPAEHAGGLNAPSAAISAGILHLIGGFSTTSNRPVADHWTLDLATRAWKQRAPMPAPRGGHAMVAFGGKLHIVGGGNDQTTLADHLAYDPARDTWQSLAPLPRAKGSPALVVVNGALVAIGGRSGPDDFGDVHRYDTARDAWVALGSIAPRGTAGAVAHCGQVFLVGGESQRERQVLDRVERIGERELLEGGQWQLAPPLAIPRAFARTVVFSGKIHVVGGAVAYGSSHEAIGTQAVEILDFDCARP
jgi:N-acetylneuraminic acid mutarotase